MNAPPGSPPSVTVLLASRNGGAVLRGVLEAYEALEPPPGGFHVVVADNGSDDDTPAMLRSFEARLPLTIVTEPRPGKNRALNAALPRVAGALVVLTDDDATPRADWLVQYARAAAAHPEATLFAGTVLPRWEAPPPAWILEAVPFGPAFALTGKRHREGAIPPELIFGPNMAVRRAVFDGGVRFDETIGPAGGSYAMGSETELTTRLARAGHKTWFCEAAVVEHFVRRHQLDRAWLLRRAIRYGRGSYRLGVHALGAPERTIFGVPPLTYKRVVGAALATARTALAGGDVARFEARWDLNQAVGEWLEARNMKKASGSVHST
jgi:glycosyltransferase involved in cell wall biosynthesis